MKAPDLESSSNRRIELHTSFLLVAAEHPEANHRHFGNAAFLLMRLVDYFSSCSSRDDREALWYQLCTTRDYINALSPNTPYYGHLNDSMCAVAAAYNDDKPRNMLPSLHAFARCLEGTQCFSEALDVAQTARKLSDGRDAPEEVQILLLMGKLLRVAGEYREAVDAYTRGSEMAGRLGDTHSALLGRIGRGIVARMVGNLPKSERLLREVVAEAHELGDRDAGGRASHDLADTLYYAGRAHESVTLAFQAYELYESEALQTRALCDTGTYLMELGYLTAARNAFTLATHGDRLAFLDRIPVDLELLRLHCLLGDRISFERLGRALSEKRDQMVPDQHQDLELKLGVGYAHFGQFEIGESHLQRALELAEEYGLNERVFYAEEQLRAVHERTTEKPAVKLARPISGIPSVQETADRLERLVVAGDRSGA